MNDDEYTIKSRLIDVGNGHQIYTQLWGNPKAKKPIVYTHGGPGGANNDKYKRLYNPKQHLVLFFDQRGCGQSLPYGEIKNNTLNDTICDINTIADYYGFKNFSIVGSSWSSCVALYYAIKHPNRVDNLYLDGIFTCSQTEVNHLENGGFRDYYPDAWKEFLDETPIKYHNTPGEHHLNNILGDDVKLAKKSSYTHSKLLGNIYKLDTQAINSPMDEDYDYLPSKIYAHFNTNNYFIPDKYIINNAHKITAKTTIIQGRYDLVCPPITAYTIANRINGCNLIWTVAGHTERATKDAKKALLANHE